MNTEAQMKEVRAEQSELPEKSSTAEAADKDTPLVSSSHTVHETYNGAVLVPNCL